MGKKKRNKSGQAGGSVAVATEIRQVPGSRPQGLSVSSDSKPAFYSSRYFEWLALALASVISYWILTSRLVGINVSVLVDEYSYVLDTHYRALSETAYPNHLFQLVYSITKNCGPEFYSCARSINALFVVGSGLVLYLFAKHLSKKYWLAAAAFVVTVFGSMGTYTAYFMPEAIFNFFMVTFFYALTRFSLSSNLLVWAGMGVILGLASLAKPHAFFIVPALIVYIVLLTRATEQNFLLAAAKRLTASGLTLVGTKFAIGYAIAGERGLSVFGSYGGAISSGEAVATTLGVNTWMNVPVTAWGQILMITMILGFSLPVAILGLLESLKKDKEIFVANRFRSLFALALLNMMAVVAVFEAWQNLTNWMHTRYNSYLIPLAIIVLIEAYLNADKAPGKLTKRITVGGFVLLSLIALFTAAMPYGANWIDAPDFKAHIDNLMLSSIAIVIAISLAIWWLWNTKVPIVAGVIFMVASSIFSGTHISNFLVSNFGQDTSFDHLARVLRDFIPQEELDKTLVVGESHTSSERVLFASLSGGARLGQVGEDGFNATDVGPDDRWVVNAGENVVRGFGPPHITGPGFAIYSTNKGNQFIPRNNDALSISGLCSDQTWGCGSEVQVQLDSKIGKSGVVDLILDVSEVASRGNIDFVVGDVVLTGQLPAGLFALSLSFPGLSEIETLTIRASLDSDAADLGPNEKFLRVVSVNVNNR